MNYLRQKKMEVNKELVKERFSKATATYTKEALVQYRIASTMMKYIQEYIPSDNLRNILEIGCGTGTFSGMLQKELSPHHLLLNDICPEMEGQLGNLLNEQTCFQPGDAETCSFSDGWDMIASCSVLQWFNDPATFFIRCSSLLIEEGYLTFSTFGKDNMKEVSTLTGSSLNYYSREELIRILSVQYDIIYWREENIVTYFPSARDVLLHLKRTGVTGIHKQTWTRTTLNMFCEEYEKKFHTEKGLSLTYNPIYILARKKRNEE